MHGVMGQSSDAERSRLSIQHGGHEASLNSCAFKLSLRLTETAYMPHASMIQITSVAHVQVLQSEIRLAQDAYSGNVLHATSTAPFLQENGHSTPVIGRAAGMQHDCI